MQACKRAAERRMAGREVLCSRKNMREQGEIGFVKASISHVVTRIETHSNDSLKRVCEPQEGHKWQYLEVMWEQVARVRHSLEARTKRDT